MVNIISDKLLGNKLIDLFIYAAGNSFEMKNKHNQIYQLQPPGTKTLFITKISELKPRIQIPCEISLGIARKI
jgi:hypothetical protein